MSRSNRQWPFIVVRCARSFVERSSDLFITFLHFLYIGKAFPCSSCAHDPQPDLVPNARRSNVHAIFVEMDILSSDVILLQSLCYGS